MIPTATEYLHGLRRMWWIPVATTLLGWPWGSDLGERLPADHKARGNVVFGFATNELGDNAAAAARSTEVEVAKSRLRVYVETAKTSPEVRDILAENGIDVPLTEAYPDNPVQIDTLESEAGIVEIRIDSAEIDPAEAEQLVAALAEEVSRQVLIIDMQQDTPSLRPDPLTTQSPAVEVPAPHQQALPCRQCFWP